jgi:hypothetical protein
MERKKKKELRLEFVENGRLTVDEMGKVLGGEIFVNERIIGCSYYIKCPPNEYEKSYCDTYKNCGGGTGRIKCDLYWWVRPEDFAIDIHPDVVDIRSDVSIDANAAIATVSII